MIMKIESIIWEIKLFIKIKMVDYMDVVKYCYILFVNKLWFVFDYYFY